MTRPRRPPNRPAALGAGFDRRRDLRGGGPARNPRQPERCAERGGGLCGGCGGECGGGTGVDVGPSGKANVVVWDGSQGPEQREEFRDGPRCGGCAEQLCLQHLERSSHPRILFVDGEAAGGGQWWNGWQKGVGQRTGRGEGGELGGAELGNLAVVRLHLLLEHVDLPDEVDVRARAQLCEDVKQLKPHQLRPQSQPRPQFRRRADERVEQDQQLAGQRHPCRALRPDTGSRETSAWERDVAPICTAHGPAPPVGLCTGGTAPGANRDAADKVILFRRARQPRPGRAVLRAVLRVPGASVPCGSDGLHQPCEA
mmetsp:Transcript_30626/g.99052  ORF Transcript_30626/g.99052 Transcript_30626/m.99052 type:complete len:313 (-) Transcript_30626:225-1163(-)